MNYVVFSVDDSRKHYTDRLRTQLAGSFWFNEIKTWCVDGRDPEELSRAQHKWTYDVSYNARVGQLGIWYTVLNALSDSPGRLVTFEDDAILNPQFQNGLFWKITDNLPLDTDAFSLFLPRDQDDIYQRSASELWVGGGVCKAYQRYGGVSMLWTPKGINKFFNLIARDGITDQWDNQLYAYGKAGEMNVYTQTPSNHVLVGISGTDTSIVQETAAA